MKKRSSKRVVTEKKHTRVRHLVLKPEPDSSWPLGVPKISSILEPSIEPGNIVLHLRLLERFIELKQNVEGWAESEDLSPGRVWSFTINLAAKRMFRWFSASKDHPVGQKLPPLDVVLVWYCFLSRPERWEKYVKETGLVDVECFPWDKLQHALTLSNLRPFKLPLRSVQVASRVFDVLDIMDVLKSHLDLLKRPRQPFDGEWTAPLYSHQVPNLRARIPCIHLFDMNFHESVRECLKFADRILQYSWDSMYPHISIAKQHFRPAIDRYVNYMKLQCKYKKRVATDKKPKPFSALVAAPDVELVWRTHVLEHRAYDLYRQDLRLGHPPLHFNSSWDHSTENMDFTNTLYVKRFRGIYKLCLCWYCMASRNTAQMRGFSPILASVTLQMEKGKAGKSVKPINFDLAEKQCQCCGMHPWTACEKDDQGSEHSREALKRRILEKMESLNECCVIKACVLALHGCAAGVNLVYLSA